MARRLVRPGQPSHDPELGHGRGRASRRHCMQPPCVQGRSMEKRGAEAWIWDKRPRCRVTMLMFCISINLDKSVDVETLYQPKNNNESSACDWEI
jgi:hypothetical protein